MTEAQIQKAVIEPCGTGRNGKPVYDLIGLRFGRLVVRQRASKDGRGASRWQCACDCGGEATCFCVDLRRGHSTSCGCAKAEQSARNGKANNRHGHTRGRLRSPEYISWSCMHARCRVPGTNSFELYGGRGISVCERWSSFENFLADMGSRPTPRHSIDRRDGDGNYTPENCRWSTHAEQQANRRDRQCSK